MSRNRSLISRFLYSGRVPFAVIRYLSRMRGRISTYQAKKRNVGSNTFLDPTVQIIGWNNIRIGSHTILSEDVWLNVNHRETIQESILIGNHCFIGRRNFMTSGNYIRIGDYCLTGVDCHFLGADHVYESPYVPYVATGVTREGSIEIGANCWFGTRVTVLKNSKIGYGCIIGANTTIRGVIPPFSMVVGNPHKIIRRFDIKSLGWVKVETYDANNDHHLIPEDEYVSRLQNDYDTLAGPLHAASKLMGDL